MYREAMTKASERATYPTEQMIEDADKELKQFRFTYLPEGVPQLSQDNLESVTIDELDQVVSQTLTHLKRDLIPKLKQMQGTVQKRNTWLECHERNKYQNTIFESENDHVHKLIVEDQERIG